MTKTTKTAIKVQGILDDLANPANPANQEVRLISPRQQGTFKFCHDDSGYEIPIESMPVKQIDKRIVLKPEDASKFLANNVFSHQRKIQEKRLRTQCKAIQNGLHHGNTIADAVLGFDYFIEVYDGKGGMNLKKVERLLVNAQHTLHAVMATKIPLDVTYQEWFCPSFSALATLWATFDQPGSQRTPEEIASAFLESFSEPGWSNKSLNKVASAFFAASLGEMSGNMQYGSRSTTAERINMLMENENRAVRKFVKDVCWGHQKEVDSKFMQRIVVMMIMIQTYRASPRMAQQFWEPVLFGGNRVGGPSEAKYELNQWLKNHVVGNTTGGDKRKAVTNKDMQIVCIRAWNAFMDDVQIKFTKIGEHIPTIKSVARPR